MSGSRWLKGWNRSRSCRNSQAGDLPCGHIAAAKRKNDRIDAAKIADCLRCDFLPESYMASTEIRDRRRTLRYRSLVVKQVVQMKNRVSGLLMENGVNYTKARLHKVG